MSDLSGNTYGLYRSDRGYFLTGTSPSQIVFPIQDGAGLSFPDKYRDVPGTANNVYDVSYYNGLYYPSARIPADVMASWFTAANLNAMFVTRGATRGEKGYDDLFDIAGDPPVFSDGKRAINMVGAKGSSLSLSTRQDDIIRATLGIMAAGETEGTWSPVAAPTGPRASFANFLAISGVDGVVDWSLTIDNQTSPSPVIGSGAGSAAIEINAAKPRVMLNLVVDAAGTYPTHGGTMSFSITPPGGSAVTFTVLKVRLNQPDNLEKRPVRASQTFQVIAQSPDGVTFPLTIS